MKINSSTSGSKSPSTGSSQRKIQDDLEMDLDGFSFKDDNDLGPATSRSIEGGKVQFQTPSSPLIKRNYMRAQRLSPTS